MHEIVENQRKFFLTHITRDVEFRRRALKKLQQTIREWEPRISEALHADLGKCATEGYMCEIGLVLGSLRDTLKNLRKWTKPRSVMSSLAHFPSSCRVEANPYGVVLIMSPWNYPVLLCLDPLIANRFTCLRNCHGFHVCISKSKPLHVLRQPAHAPVTI